MVRINRIYTRTGDDGSSGLVDGSRRRKDDPRFAVIGDVDETNAAIGMARLAAGDHPDLDRMLGAIQNDLFDLGADLATPETEAAPAVTPLRILAAQVARIEADIDRLNEDIAPLRSFVLPGGSALSAHLHLARAVSRRAERSAVTLSGVEPVNPEALRYINRLSDFLFVAARAANGFGARDVLWVPGKTRD